MSILKKIKKRMHILKSTLDEIGAKGWDRVLLTFDIFYCKTILHANNEEYLAYKFYNLKNRYRKQFMLTYHQRNFMRYLNEPNFTVRKSQFYQRIPQFFQRQIILAPDCGAEAFLDFVKSHGTVVLKPDYGSYGRGIEKLQYTNDEDVLAYFSSIRKKTVCEEFVVQHDAMNLLNPTSINTIRFLTLRKDDEIAVISASLRAATKQGVFVDNMRQGGIGAQVCIDSGITCTHGYDYLSNQYMMHPITQCPIMGFQIPNWDKSIALVKNAHAAIKECDYLAWDIAITPDGADIIEANNAPDPMITQFMDLVPKGTLVLPILKARRKTGKGANGVTVISQKTYNKGKKSQRGHLEALTK